MARGDQTKANRNEISCRFVKKCVDEHTQYPIQGCGTLVDQHASLRLRRRDLSSCTEVIMTTMILVGYLHKLLRRLSQARTYYLYRKACSIYSTYYIPLTGTFILLLHIAYHVQAPFFYEPLHYQKLHHKP